MKHNFKSIKSNFNLIRQFHFEPRSSYPVNIKSMIRVNLAGEAGANKIYAGQMAVLSIYSFFF